MPPAMTKQEHALLSTQIAGPATIKMHEQTAFKREGVVGEDGLEATRALRLSHLNRHSGCNGARPLQGRRHSASSRHLCQNCESNDTSCVRRPKTAVTESTVCRLGRSDSSVWRLAVGHPLSAGVAADVCRRGAGRLSADSTSQIFRQSAILRRCRCDARIEQRMGAVP